jgi:HPt (histidine-containing phosphotransfer) domain-containing protein
MPQALERVRGNKTLYRRMLNLFLDSPEFALLEERLASKDYEKAAVTAHTIKGMTGNLSLNAIFELSAALMSECRQGAPNAETITQYREAYQKTVAAVKEVAAEIDAGMA